MTSIKRLAKWVNIVDSVIQLTGTCFYIIAIRSFESALLDGARLLKDDGFRARLEQGFQSTTWSWLNIVPYLLLLSVVIHKCLFVAVARRPSSRFDMVAFGFDSACVLATMARLTYWLATSALVEVATFLDVKGMGNALHWVHIWIAAMATMTVAMAIAVLIDFLYLGRAWTANRESDEEFAVPFLTEQVV